MKILKFNNAVFNKGHNLTVRRGVKWGCEVEAEIMVENLGLIDIGLQTSVMRFTDLIDKDLVDEHDIDCRTVEGLLAVMKEVYPSFDEYEIVTLVTFEL